MSRFGDEIELRRGSAAPSRCSGISIASCRRGLYLVATPIGNLADITLRALSVLARADIILCEDTRHSRTLLSHFGIEATTRPYHEHNAARERPRVLADLAAGRRVALISDAGTPLVSDPGYKLVRASLEAGHRVEALPGPSAALAALERCRAADGRVLLCRLPAAEERGAALTHRRAQIRCRQRSSSSRRHRA